ncbi:hypothetical protein BH10CYA1_BH10CYA1_05920 [soil metagenome]
MRKSNVFVKIRSASVKRSDGFSLVTVTLFGLIATMWLTATLTSVLPAYQLASQNRTRSSARAAAEAAADWAVDSLNAAVLDPALSPSSLDSTTTTPTTTSVPAAVLNNALALATVTVFNVTPPTTSYLYDPTTVPGVGQFTTITTNGWRVIEAKATIGGITKQVRTIIKPGYRPTNSNTPNNPSSNYSVFGASSVNIEGNALTDGYNSALGYSASHLTAIENPSAGLGGDVGSLSSVKLGNNVTIGGSVDVTLQPAGSNTNTAFGQNSTTVNRYMNLNGTQDGSFADNTTTDPNVKGYSNKVNGFPDDLSTAVRPDSILEKQGATQPQLPSAPSAPTMFTDASTNTLPVQNLGSMSIGGETTTATSVIVTNGASAPPYSIVQGTTNFIRPGNYTANSLDVGSNGQIIVSSNVTASQPFRLFVDGTTPGPNAVNVTGNNGIRNFGVPSNLQIYYNGSKNVNLQSLRGLSAVVYAPNASLNMNPSTAQVGFFGSFVGNSVNAKNAAIHFDTALKSGDYLNALGSGNSYGSKISKSQQQFAYSTVSWQEF